MGHSVPKASGREKEEKTQEFNFLFKQSTGVDEIFVSGVNINQTLK